MLFVNFRLKSYVFQVGIVTAIFIHYVILDEFIKLDDPVSKIVYILLFFKNIKEEIIERKPSSLLRYILYNGVMEYSL